MTLAERMDMAKAAKAAFNKAVKLFTKRPTDADAREALLDAMADLESAYKEEPATE